MSRELKQARITDLLRAALLASCFLLLAQLHAAYPGFLTVLLEDETSHLGAEYDNIANALFEGKGFSNPFRDETGPTAWMPPVLPYLMATAYWFASGDRDFVVAVVCGMHWLGVVWHVWLALRVARSVRLRKTGLVLSSLWLLALFPDYFQSAHDAGLLLLCTAALTEASLAGLNRLPTQDEAAHDEAPQIGCVHSIAWGVLGGMVALCSPVLGAVWAALTLWFLAKLFFATQPKALLVGGLAILTSILVVTPWTIRSYLAMGKLVPIKSNSGYELWQSQVIDRDGVLDGETCRDHPWVFDGKERQAYKRLGEIDFIRNRSQTGFQSILSYPQDFFRRVLRRALAALVVWHRFNPDPESWGWGIPDVIRYSIQPMPLLALILLFACGVQWDSTLRLVVFLWLFTLAPYILISYYERYALPLLGMKLIIVILGFRAGIDAFEAWRRPRIPSRQE